MKTYIFLSKEDKFRIQKLADAKSLSFSTCCGIIIRHLKVLNTWKEFDKNNYIKKGDIKTCISIKNINHILDDLTSSIATNCIYQYLHEESCNYNIKQVKKAIQSEMDKTKDYNQYKNLEIRIAYRIQKGIYKQC